MGIEAVVNGQPQGSTVALQLTVVLLADGNVGIQGNTPNAMVALGMLELAKVGIIQQMSRKPGGAVQATPGSDPGKR